MGILNEVENLLSPLQKIKFKQRKGWVERGFKSDSIAGHSLDAVFVGWYLAKKEGLDEDKIIKILTIHDLVMAYLEDITPNSERYKSKRDLENESFHKVLENTPKELKREYKDLWEEFQKGKTEQARLAREADKLATIMQGYFYKKESNKQTNFLREFIDYYENYIKTNTGKKLLKELRSKN